MGTVTHLEDEWQRRAMAASIEAARGLIGPSHAIPAGVPIGTLSTVEFGWLVSAIIFGWISTRAHQAAEEGAERIAQAMRDGPEVNGINPWDAGAIISILPILADEAPVSWDKP